MLDSTEESNGHMKYNFTALCVEEEIDLFEWSTIANCCQLHKLLD